MRDLAETLHTVRFFVWLVTWEAVGIAAAAYWTPDHSRGAQVAIAVSAFIAATSAALLLPLATLWVTAPVRQRDEARSALAGELSRSNQTHDRAKDFSMESADFDGHHLRFNVRNDGPTLKDVMINVLVPETFNVIIRRTRKGEPALGYRHKTPETLDGAAPSIYWEETGLTLKGYGTSNYLVFITHGKDKDVLPYKFKIGADELGGWKVALVGHVPVVWPEKRT